MAMTSGYYWQEKVHRMPCGCGDCPECQNWNKLDGDATYPLTVRDNGNCYYRGKLNIAIVLPDISTLLPGGYCITVNNEVTPKGNVYIRPFESDPSMPHMIVNGILYDYITVDDGGEVCVCFDGVNYTVTGNASGWDGT